MSKIAAPLVRRRPPPAVPTRLLAFVVLGATVVWAIVQGAHSHDSLRPVAADLSGAEVSRVIHVDASTRRQGSWTSRTSPSRRVR